MNKKLLKIFELVLVILIIFILYIVNSEDSNYMKDFDSENMIELTDWNLIGSDGNEEEIELPVRLKESQEKVIIQRKLLENVGESSYLLFFGSHSAIEVYSGDELIYDFGNSNVDFFPLEGNGYHLVKLNKDSNGKVITIVQSMAVDKYRGRINQVYLSDKASAIISVIRWNGVGLLTCILILSFAIILLFLWIATKKTIGDNRLLHLAFFAILIYMWSINETMITTLFFGKLKVISFVSYASIMCSSIPLLHFFMCSKKIKVRKIAGFLLWLPIGEFIIATILHFLKIYDYSESLMFSHVVILIIVVTILAGYISEIKEIGISRIFISDSGVKLGALGFIIMSILVACDLVLYYFGEMYDNSMFSRIGLLIYILALAIETLGTSFKMIELGYKAKVYQYIAYHDELTNIRNRSFYNEELVRIDENPDKKKNIFIMVIDINDLKKINDEKGHGAGDLYITRTVSYIREKLQGIGDFYRIGGDEFVVIIKDYEKKVIEEKMKLMDDFLEKERDISFAYGYACFDDEKDMDINDTVKRADEMMYEKKRQMKESNVFVQ